MLNISHNLLNTVLKVKNKMIVRVQNGSKCNCYSPSGLRVWLGAVAATIQHQVRTVPYITNIGKGQNSKYSLYWMLTAFESSWRQIVSWIIISWGSSVHGLPNTNNFSWKKKRRRRRKRKKRREKKRKLASTYREFLVPSTLQVPHLTDKLKLTHSLPQPLFFRWVTEIYLS